MLLPASSQGLARFAYDAIPQPPGFKLDANGFRVDGAAGDTIKFASSIEKAWHKELTPYNVLVQGRDYALTPGAVRVTAFMPGFELYFPLGLELRMTSNLSPFLSWGEGTVNAGVPTAPSKWVMLSFQDKQPPVLLVTSEPVQYELSGKSGDYKLRTLGRYKGWVRVLAPLGSRGLSSSVSALGEAVQQVKRGAAQIKVPSPQLLSFQAKAEEDAVVGVWTFDSAGAALPPPVLLCRAGGFSTSVLTGTTEPLLDVSEGPVAFSKEPRIAVRFPLRRVPLGRPLAEGKMDWELPGSVSGFDYAGVSELALAQLIPQRSPELHALTQGTLEEFSRSLSVNRLPITGQTSVLPESGDGLDLVASHLLLQMCSMIASGENPPLGFHYPAVLDRMDARLWLLVASQPDVARRASALASLAMSLSVDPEVRLRGAMLQAGLVAQKTMPLYRSRRGFARQEESNIDPYAALRASIFSSVDSQRVVDPFLSMLRGEIRILTPVGVSISRETNGYLVKWTHTIDSPRKIEFLTGYPVEVEAKANLLRVTPSSVMGSTILGIEPKGPGECAILIRQPGFARPLPLSVVPPRYVE